MPIQRPAHLAAVALAVGIGGAALTSATGTLGSPRAELISALSAVTGGRPEPTPAVADTEELAQQAQTLREQIETLQHQIYRAESAGHAEAPTKPDGSPSSPVGAPARRTTTSVTQNPRAATTSEGSPSRRTTAPAPRSTTPRSQHVSEHPSEQASEHEPDTDEGSKDIDD